MTPEHRRKPLPDWAVRDRHHDMEWIGENLHVFWPAARAAFKEQGRGALVADTTLQPVPGKGHPFAYFPQEVVETGDDEDLKRMVSQYDPEHELVISLLKPEDRTSNYRVFTNLPDGQPPGA